MSHALDARLVFQLRLTAPPSSNSSDHLCRVWFGAISVHAAACPPAQKNGCGSNQTREQLPR